MKGNLCIKRMLVLVFVWIGFLLLQVIKASSVINFSVLNIQECFLVELIAHDFNIVIRVALQNKTMACSRSYWVLNLLQVKYNL